MTADGPRYCPLPPPPSDSVQSGAVVRLPEVDCAAIADSWDGKLSPQPLPHFGHPGPGITAVECQLVGVLQTLQPSVWPALGAFPRLPHMFGLPQEHTEGMSVKRTAIGWSQQAYSNAPNTTAFESFGNALSLPADRLSMVVGAYLKSINAWGIDGDQSNDLANWSGADYLY